MPNINLLNKVDFPTKSAALQVCDTVLTFPRTALGYEDITYKKAENAKNDQTQYQVSQALRVNNAFVRFFCVVATIVLMVPTLIALAIKACLMKGQNEEIQKIENGVKQILNESNASSSNSASSTNSTKKPQNVSSTTSATAAKKLDSSKKDSSSLEGNDAQSAKSTTKSQNVSSTTSGTAVKKLDPSKKDDPKLIGIDAQITIFEGLDAALKNQDIELIISNLKAISDEESSPSNAADNKAKAAADPANALQRTAVSAPSAVGSKFEEEEAKRDVINFYKMLERKQKPSKEEISQAIDKLEKNRYAAKKLAEDYEQMWPVTAMRFFEDGFIKLIRRSCQQDQGLLYCQKPEGAAKRWKDLYPEFA